MVPQGFQSRVHVLLRPRLRAVMVRAGLSGVAPRIILARVRVHGTARRHQPEQLRRYHHHVVAVGGILRAHARPIRHVAVYVNRVR